MGAIAVLNDSGVDQVLGSTEIPADRKWHDVPMELEPALRAMGGFRFEDDADLMHYDEQGGLHFGWSSPLYYSDGYGSIAQEIAAEFIRMGVQLSVWPRDYDPGHHNFGQFSLDEWEQRAFVPHEIVETLRQDPERVLYGFNMTWPPKIGERPFPRCIGFTMFETSRPPEHWAEPMNAVRRIVVPCQQNKRAFESIGVTTPIDVVTLSVDPAKWPVCDRTRRDQPFTFLMAGGLTHRKNPVGAAEAFIAAFPPSIKDVRLIIKTRGSKGASGFHRDWIGKLPQDDRIQLVMEESTPEQMVGWMHKADAFVFPSRGEGFGLPPLQAMCTGLPVIVSDNSGMSEYAQSGKCYPVLCHEVPVPAHADGGYPSSWGDCGNWWEPDSDSLVEQYKRVYAYCDDAQWLGRAAAKWVRSHWTIRHTCDALLEVLMRDYRDAVCRTS